MIPKEIEIGKFRHPYVHVPFPVLAHPASLPREFSPQLLVPLPPKINLNKFVYNQFDVNKEAIITTG